MFWLNVFDNQVLHLVAETSAIVIGSMLMGILLAYLHWGTFRKKVDQLNNKLDFERNQVAELNIQLNEVSSIRSHLATEISDEKLRQNTYAKTIYDQQQQLYKYESQLNDKSSSIDNLNATIDSYQHRLRVIEEEIVKTRNSPVVQRKLNPVPVTRANYEHVSQLLGRQVTENDLSLIVGIGPRTAFLLQSIGIDTWDKLAETPLETLREILTDAGGVYKSLDPTHWPKQAVMAASSEWRKLRVFQESLK